jgi:hypothetical protein
MRGYVVAGRIWNAAKNGAPNSPQGKTRTETRNTGFFRRSVPFLAWLLVARPRPRHNTWRVRGVSWVGSGDMDKGAFSWVGYMHR